MGSTKHVEGAGATTPLRGGSRRGQRKRREKLLPGAEGDALPRCKAIHAHPQILSKNYPETVYFIRFI